MWLVACSVYVVAALWILAGWIRRSAAEGDRRPCPGGAVTFAWRSAPR